jgi:hypothetical protein
MRVIQNAALFGLICGTGVLFYGMTQGSMAFSILGAGLGILIGVPAAYLHFAIQGMNLFNGRGLLGKFQESVRDRVGKSDATAYRREDPPQRITPFHTPDDNVDDVPVVVGSKRAEPEIIRPKIVPNEPPITTVEHASPETVTDEAIAIPVRVIPPETPENQAEAILAEVLPESEPEPKVVGLSDAERRTMIDQIEAATVDDIDVLLEFAVHKDTLVRLYAIQKLGALGDPSVESTLTDAYTDDAEMIVRRAARLSLSKLGLGIPETSAIMEENASELAAHE